MHTHTTRDRALAIAAGAAFTAGGLTILMGETLLSPAHWSSYHVLTILTVGGTIAAGHLMADAWRARAVAAATGFLVLFLAGTGLVVYQSVGRQAAASDTRTLSAEARNQTIADKHADLDRARARLADAERMVDHETRNGGCPDRRRDGRRSNCSDWKQRAEEVRSHISVLEGEIARLGAPEPIAPKATRMADLAALLGADHARAKAAFTLLEPFLWTLFFEIGSVVSLGFAFRHAPIVRRAPSDTWAISDYPALAAHEAANVLSFFRPDGPADDRGRPDNPGRRGPRRPAPTPSAPDVPADDRKQATLQALLTDLALGRTIGSQREACARYGIERSTMSDWLTEWEAAGLIPARRTVGRRKEIAAA